MGQECSSIFHQQNPTIDCCNFPKRVEKCGVDLKNVENENAVDEIAVAQFHQF